MRGLRASGRCMPSFARTTVSAVVRAYDPCLSCSTHADGQIALDIRLVDAGGSELDAVRS